MEKNINKILAIISSILILITIIIAIFFVPLQTSDELWNFQNIFKMCNGFKIYNDSNVIITPLFFYFEFIILKICGATFFIFRISNLLIILPLFYCYYKILTKLNVRRCISLLFLAFIFYITILFFTANGPNYNNLALLFFMIGIYFYVSTNNSNYLQGFISFLIFFTKQTTGMFYILAIILYELYKYKFSKNFFKNQIEKLASFILPTLLIIFMMYFNGNLYNCLNYTLGGLFDFSRNNIVFSPKLYSIFIIFLSYTLSISILLTKKNLLNSNFTKDFFDKIIFLNIFATCASFILYPIFNIAHVLMVLPIFLIIIIYIFDSIFKNIFDSLKFQLYINIASTIIVIIAFIDIIFNLILPYKYVDATFISDISSPYFGVPLFDEEIKKIEILKNYISYKNEHGTDVIICYNDAAFVMIPLKQSHSAYDLIFYGNLGYNGIEKMKQDILSKEHTEFLVNNDNSYDDNQFVTEIQDFIEENLTKIGEISHYDVYTK